jgi:hypothetical protein
MEGQAMSTGVCHQYTLALSEHEREVLLNILEEVLKVTQIEEHRTEAFRAKEVVRSRERALESLLQKIRAAGPS